MKKPHILKKGEISAFCSKCESWLHIVYSDIVACKCRSYKRKEFSDYNLTFNPQYEKEMLY